MKALASKQVKFFENTYVKLAAQSVLGCAFLVLCSLIKIPFYPVSFSLQTLAIFLLGLNMNRSASALSSVLFLILATLGAPVMFGVVKPLWFIDIIAGYYIAMPIASYIIGSMKSRPYLALSLATATILGLGSIGVSFFVGIQKAIVFGALIFLPGEIFKASFALYLKKKRSI